MNVRPLLTMAVLLQVALALMAQPPSSASNLIQQSGFIFRGTVQKTGASNVKALPAGPKTIIVRVDEIMKSPKELEAFLGREITVQERNSNLKVNQQAVFYTTGWLYGESIAVKEVATVTARVDSKSLKDQVAQSERQSSEGALAARVASSVLIISGRVLEVSPLISKEESVRRSEHDPELWRATVEIATVLKGQKPAANSVAVVFAHSTDEMWYFSPKYSTGDQGIFLLHTQQRETLPQGAFSTLNRLDFQPSSQLDLVNRLIKTGR